MSNEERELRTKWYNVHAVMTIEQLGRLVKILKLTSAVQTPLEQLELESALSMIESKSKAAADLAAGRW